jgi:hypothetical protein
MLLFRQLRKIVIPETPQALSGIFAAVNAGVFDDPGTRFAWPG